MTTQRTSRALAREAAGLCITAFGVLGVLAALSALHWAVGLSVAMSGILVASLLLTPGPDAPLAFRILRWTACGIGYSGLTGCAFALCVPLGWIGVALAVTAVGLWLTTGREPEGA